MELSEYILLFVFVTILGAGIPGPGDASLIAAGTLAGEGKLNVGIVLATAAVAWMLGSVVGFVIGMRGGRPLLDHPGRLAARRRKLLAKGDRAFGRHTFVASMTMPAFVSGIFRVRFGLFVLGALVAGVGWIGMYVGVSYFLGAEIAHHVASKGAKTILSVIVLVIVGLCIRAGWSRWRATRRKTAPSTDDAVLTTSSTSAGGGGQGRRAVGGGEFGLAGEEPEPGRSGVPGVDDAGAGDEVV